MSSKLQASLFLGLGALSILNKEFFCRSLSCLLQTRLASCRWWNRWFRQKSTHCTNGSDPDLTRSPESVLGKLQVPVLVSFVLVSFVVKSCGWISKNDLIHSKKTNIGKLFIYMKTIFKHYPNLIILKILSRFKINYVFWHIDLNIYSCCWLFHSLCVLHIVAKSSIS